MSVQPLPPDDRRNEELTFKDNSWLEIDATMRADNPKVYDETCRLAVSRKFCTVIDASKKLVFPASNASRSDAGGPAKSFK
jgi:hypothetical protein